VKVLPAVAVTCLALTASLAIAAPRTLPPIRPSGAARPPMLFRSRPLTYHPGEVLVLMRDAVSPRLDARGRLVAGSAAMENAIERHGLLHGEALGANPVDRGTRLLRLRSDRPDFDPVAAARDLIASGGVRAACPNYRIPVASTFPNDSLLSLQWHIYQPSPRADIHLPEAWDLQKGSPSTVIAIVDMGIDIGHPDLASRIWTNSAEIPGNGIDDDGNGLIDDVHGWDFGDNDNDPSPNPTFEPDFGIDIAFHGTFCAGVAAAATNNLSGIAGAGWNCKILAIKGAKADSGLSTDAVVEGMEYAAQMHANVLSMSFGAANDTTGEVKAFFQAIIDDALAAGTICVAAAGNDGDTARVFPAACDGVISVAATEENDQRASFSNFGPWVDVAAPGQDMWSIINTNYPIDENSQLWYWFLWGYDFENPYMYNDGTSFACPLVAGMLGLCKTQYPTLTPAAAKELLKTSGDVIAYDQPIGRKVNAYRALTQGIVGVGPGAAPAIVRLAAAPNPSVGPTRLWMSLSVAGPARLAIHDASGRRVREVASGTFAAGRHPLDWDGRDDAGHPVAAGLYFARLESAGGVASAKLVRLER
jgi:subtilisin family serine protease